MPDDSEILIQRIETEDKAVLFVRGEISPDIEHNSRILAELAHSSGLLVVWASDPNMSIESLSEAEMGEAGWIRDSYLLDDGCE